MESLGGNPLLYLAMVVAGCIVWAIRQEGQIKAAGKANDELREELTDKLTYYATTTELSEVRGQVLVAVSQLNDLKPMLIRLEGKIDAFLIANVQHETLKTRRVNET